mgnify:CR=1 FL=1
MAKKQTFGDKVNKSSEHEAKKSIKVIRTLRSKNKGFLKFSESMLSFNADKNPDAAIKEFFKK